MVSEVYLLVDDHETFVVPITNFLFEFNYFLYTCVNKSPFCLNQLFSFRCTLVKEPGIYLPEKIYNCNPAGLTGLLLKYCDFNLLLFFHIITLQCF